MADLKGHANALIEAFNNADWDTYMNLVGDGVYTELATGRSLSGESLKEALIGWRTAFPDATGTVTSTIEQGNQVVQEITWTGTHTGPLATPDGSIPPSGARQTTPAVIVTEYDGDSPRESRHYFDMLTLLTQIGAA